jgi:hypothetical protein
MPSNVRFEVKLEVAETKLTCLRQELGRRNYSLCFGGLCAREFSVVDRVVSSARTKLSLHEGKADFPIVRPQVRM